MNPSTCAVAMPLLDEQLLKLQRAIARRSSDGTCHRLWSRFVRSRDLYRCVVCGSADAVQAHHVCRRSFLREARFDTGNGATLCRECHREAHAGFNRTPDLMLPMDAQGGEKIARIAELYGVLARASHAWPERRVAYYHLSDQVLSKFKMFQGFGPERALAGTPIEQAWYVWDQSAVPVVTALIHANYPDHEDGHRCDG